MSIKNITVTCTANKIKELNESLKFLKRNSLYVGIPKGENRKDCDFDNSWLGLLHEKGSSDGRIPARPFLMPAVEGQKAQINKAFARAMKAALADDKARMIGILEECGMDTALAVKLYIRDSSHFVPNSPETIRRKTVDDRVKDKPLIDSSALLGSIQAIVTKD